MQFDSINHLILVLTITVEYGFKKGPIKMSSVSAYAVFSFKKELNLKFKV